ncbi:MAG: T9SS type A sorting domain-containing protein [candidate division WOR-3 bacterium]
MLLFLLSITVNKSNLYLETRLFNNSAYSDYIYITTDEGGILSFNPEDSSWATINSISGLPSNKTKEIFIRGDSVFVLLNGGIVILNKRLERINFQEINSLFFSDTSIYTIKINKDKVLLGSSRGIQWFNLKDFGALSKKVENKDYGFKVFEILPLDTCFLVGTNRGVYKISSNLNDTLLIKPLGETYSILVSHLGIWAGGSWGCKEILSDTGSFSEYTVRDIKEIDEKIYIGTNGGLYKWSGNIWEKIYGGDIRGFYKVSDSLALVVRGEGILFEGTSNFIYPPGISSNLVTDLTQTPDGKIYVVHKFSRSISVFDGKKWKIVNRRNNWNLPGGYLFNIESDSKGRIYLGLWYWFEKDDTSHIPVIFCWEPNKDTMPYPILPPLYGRTISGMLIDKNDNLWIGIIRKDGSYVLRMQRTNENSFDWRIYQDPEVKWKRVFAEGIEGIYCGNSPTDGGAGIHILKEDGRCIKIRGNLGSSTTSMTSDLIGNIWAGLENGLVYIVGESIERSYSTGKIDGLATDYKKGVWCYNSTTGLSYLSPNGSWESLPSELKNLEPFDLKDVISPLHILERNKLFICTYKGLYEFELNLNEKDLYKVDVYPNPFNASINEELHFSARNLGGKEILIYDLTGNKKGSYKVPQGENDFSIIIDLPSGLYIYLVVTNGEVIGRGKFVVVR